jgi:hypothetical protein
VETWSSQPRFCWARGEAAESAVTEKTGTSPAIGWGGETSGAEARAEVSPCTKLCKVVLRNCGSVRVAGQSDGRLDREVVRELRCWL